MLAKKKADQKDPLFFYLVEVLAIDSAEQIQVKFA